MTTIIKYISKRGKVLEMLKSNFDGRELPSNIISIYEVDVIDKEERTRCVNPNVGKYGFAYCKDTKKYKIGIIQEIDFDKKFPYRLNEDVWEYCEVIQDLESVNLKEFLKLLEE